ncbi:MAG: helix-turn-helix domain-containing protein [Gemmatimonadota bacterium]
MAKDMFRREVATRLKEARRERTLTQRQLADLGHSTQQNISRYEKGYIPDSWFLLARLHAEKAIDLNWLLGAHATSSAVPTAIGIADAGSIQVEGDAAAAAEAEGAAEPARPPLQILRTSGSTGATAGAPAAGAPETSGKP